MSWAGRSIEEEQLLGYPGPTEDFKGNDQHLELDPEVDQQPAQLALPAT